MIKNSIVYMSRIVNEVIRGNFTGIKRIKSIKSQASDFLSLRYFYAYSDFFLLDVVMRVVIFYLLDILCV